MFIKEAKLILKMSHSAMFMESQYLKMLILRSHQKNGYVWLEKVVLVKHQY